MPLLLDTTVVIDVLRDRPAKERLLALRHVEVPYICAVTAEEVLRGLRPGEVERANRLLSGLRVAPLRTVEGAVAGTWRREFAARGVRLSQGDCLIAAAAVALGATLATGNPEHFPMDGLTVAHWPVGQ